MGAKEVSGRGDRVAAWWRYTLQLKTSRYVHLARVNSALGCRSEVGARLITAHCSCEDGKTENRVLGWNLVGNRQRLGNHGHGLDAFCGACPAVTRHVSKLSVGSRQLHFTTITKPLCILLGALAPGTICVPVSLLHKPHHHHMIAATK